MSSPAVSPSHSQDYYAIRTESDDFSDSSSSKRLRTSSPSPFVATNLRAEKNSILNEHPQLTEEALEKIYTYVETHKRLVLCFMKTTHSNFYIRPKDSDLDRAIHFNQKGQVFVHLNQSKHGDPFWGSGRFKIVKGCIELQTGDLFPSAGFISPVENDDLLPYSYFTGVFGFVQIIDEVSYSYKEHQIQKFISDDSMNDSDDSEGYYKKQRVVFSLCNSGTLEKTIFDAPEEEGLSDLDRKNIFCGLIDRINYMHSKDLIHRDLSKGNIFLHRDDNGILHPIVGDLESVCLDNDEDQKENLSTSYYIVPPEMIPLALHFKDLYTSNDPYISPDLDRESTKEELQKLADVARVTTKALDIWGLGCSLYELMSRSKLPWMLDASEQTNPVKVLENIKKITKDETWFPEPEQQNSPLHLLWEILKSDPAKRPTIEAIESRLTRIDWTQI